jgi:hypothetical protein
MRTLLCALAALGTISTATAAQADDMMPAAAGKAVVVQINAQNGSGEHGTATLIQGPAGLIVKVKLIGAPAGVGQPIHIHPGTCAALNPAPKYPLTLVMDGTSETTLSTVKLADLQTGGFAINVHQSTTAIGTYVACGDIPKAG